MPLLWGRDFLKNTWFSDESWINLWMNGCCNLGSRGEKVNLKVPKHGQKVMVYAAFSYKGVFHKIFPPKTPINSDVYEQGM